jgi:hypothetical protein
MQSAKETALLRGRSGADWEYRCGVDRDAMAREQRRRQVLQALEFERDRESALVEQLHEVVAEREGARIDEAAFAQMDPDDVALVRDALANPAGDDEDEDPLGLESFQEAEADDDPDSGEDEIARLESEIATGRSRQRAYARYLEALGD